MLLKEITAYFPPLWELPQRHLGFSVTHRVLQPGPASAICSRSSLAFPIVPRVHLHPGWVTMSLPVPQHQASLPLLLPSEGGIKVGGKLWELAGCPRTSILQAWAKFTHLALLLHRSARGRAVTGSSSHHSRPLASVTEWNKSGTSS